MDNQDKFTCSRRDFLKYSGVGVTALSVAGAGLIYNSNVASAATLSQETIDTDVLVIGGGLAGSFAAIKARGKGLDVTIADKGYVGKSGLSPFWTHHNIFDPAYGISKEEFINGVAKSEEYLTNRTYIEMWVENSKRIYEQMVSWGMFSGVKNSRGPARRVQVEKAGVRLIERTMITSLLKRDERVVGAIGFPMEEENKAIVINAKAVVMCASAGTFKTPGWPGHSLTHDGDTMAYRVGVEVTGKEFVDYHETNPQDPGSFGGRGLDTAVLVRPEVMARPALSNEQSAHAGKYPKEGGIAGYMRRSTPLSSRDLPDNPMEARPSRPGGHVSMVGGAAAGSSPHKCEGIVPQDDRCASNVPGLFAAGDGMCTYGALMDMAVCPSSMSSIEGERAGAAAAEYAMGVNRLSASEKDMSRAKEMMFAPRTKDQGFSPRWVTQVLQGLMVPYYVLSVKHEERLKATLTTVEFLRDQFGHRLLANDIHELRLAHETNNMLLNAEMRLKAGLFRTESRGTHFREDFPARDDENWLAWVIIKLDGNKMKLAKRPIPEEWRPEAGLPYKERYPYTRYLGEEEFLKDKGITT